MPVMSTTVRLRSEAIATSALDVSPLFITLRAPGAALLSKVWFPCFAHAQKDALAVVRGSVIQTAAGITLFGSYLL
jgi:hypothetical protein